VPRIVTLMPPACYQHVTSTLPVHSLTPPHTSGSTVMELGMSMTLSYLQAVQRYIAHRCTPVSYDRLPSGARAAAVCRLQQQRVCKCVSPVAMPHFTKSPTPSTRPTSPSPANNHTDSLLAHLMILVMKLRG
jgi:hypothetical protein